MPYGTVPPQSALPRDQRVSLRPVAWLREQSSGECDTPQFMGSELTGKQKRFLRGRGHHIKPLVHIGKLGLAPALIGQVAECLLAHELVKIKVLESCPVTKGECAEAISQATGASLAQMIGRTLLIYKPHPEEPVLNLPPGA